MGSKDILEITVNEQGNGNASGTFPTTQTTFQKRLEIQNLIQEKEREAMALLENGSSSRRAESSHQLANNQG